MSCGTSRFVFLHVPKTGGTWAIQAMQAAGIELEKVGEGDHPMLAKRMITFATQRFTSLTSTMFYILTIVSLCVKHCT